MKADISAYSGLKICVAVSGGRDSVALLHFLNSVKDAYNLKLTALNCDHGMRKESAKDSAFVKGFCRRIQVPLIFFNARKGALKTEEDAREWRKGCYFKAVKGLDGTGTKVADAADCIATAHHSDDNAETVLFNLARGSGLAGLCGITDRVLTDGAGNKLRIIHPFIECSREEIDGYIEENKLSFVDDETNFSDEYTRNYVRFNVIPQLEKAVPGAKRAMCRFSRLAAEDEDFIRGEAERRGVLKTYGDTAFIAACEKPLFARAAVAAVKDFFKRKDYTSAHIDALYSLAFAENGKKFGFLNLTAYKEENGITLTETKSGRYDAEVPFYGYLHGNSTIFGGQKLIIGSSDGKTEEKCGCNENGKTLRFDLSEIPETAVIRFMKKGDKFNKFGGGTKSLGDYFTDKKIPLRMRGAIPLIADGSKILIVCGVEISDGVKITDGTRDVCRITYGLPK